MTIPYTQIRDQLIIKRDISWIMRNRTLQRLVLRMCKFRIIRYIVCVQTNSTDSRVRIIQNIRRAWLSINQIIRTNEKCSEYVVFCEIVCIRIILSIKYTKQTRRQRAKQIAAVINLTKFSNYGCIDSEKVAIPYMFPEIQFLRFTYKEFRHKCTKYPSQIYGS